MTRKQRKKWSYLGTTIILGVVVGALSGTIASVLASQSINRYLQTLAQETDIFSLSEVKPRPLPGTYEEALARVQEVGWPAVAVVRPVTVDSTQVDAWVREDDVLGAGVVVTSDGWLVFHGDAFSRFAQPTSEAEVWVKGERYAIKELVEDELTRLVLVRVEAQDLPSLAFGSTRDMSGGEIIFATPDRNDVTATSLQSRQRYVTDIVLPAEQFSSYWHMATAVNQSAPLFNSSAELIGFAYEKEAIPIHHALAFIESVLRGQAGERAGLGLYVVDVGSILNLDPAVSQHVEEGALITAPSPFKAAVVPGSPAALAGLQAGDVIVAVDRLPVTSEDSLAEAITRYDVDQSATLTIWHSGETREVTVTFVDQKNLLY